MFSNDIKLMNFLLAALTVLRVAGSSDSIDITIGGNCCTGNLCNVVKPPPSSSIPCNTHGCGVNILIFSPDIMSLIHKIQNKTKNEIL